MMIRKRKIRTAMKKPGKKVSGPHIGQRLAFMMKFQWPLNQCFPAEQDL